MVDKTEKLDKKQGKRLHFAENVEANFQKISRVIKKRIASSKI